MATYAQVCCNEHGYSVNFLLLARVLQFLINTLYLKYIAIPNEQYCDMQTLVGIAQNYWPLEGLS